MKQAAGGAPQWRRGGRGGSGGGRPPCIFFLRGACRMGAACRFSHDLEEVAASALPMQHRQAVQARAGPGHSSAASAAVAAGAPSSSGGGAAAPWRFRVMSYNVLADCLAHEHAAELYASAPRFSLEWGYRSALILREVLAHRPDVVCLQEVDHFRQFQEALAPHGYEGVYTKRTGDRRDGLAMFWRADVLCPVKQRFIHFNQLGLKDNVAQLIAFQRRSGGGSSSSGPAGTGSASGSAASSRASSEEGSAGSLAGQKRRSGAEEVAPRRRHVRFDSSDDEGTSGGGGGGDGADAAAAALQAVAIEDAVAGMDRGSLRSSPSAARVEDATEPVAAAEAEAAGAPRLPALVVSNIHVLFNPRRGDLKMGQVRTLLEQVDSLCLQQLKRSGLRAAAVICGDFNTAAGSALHQYVRSGELDLALHDRKHMSGQVEARGHNWRALQQAFLATQQQQQAALAGRASWQEQQQQEQQQHADGGGAWPGHAPGLAMDAAVASLTEPEWGRSPPRVVPPYAPPATDPAMGYGSGRGKPPRPWTLNDAQLAGGSGLEVSGSSLVARHPLRLRSAYSALTGAEAPYSTCHDKFIGCVDYIWYTPGGGSNGGPSAGDSWQLQPLSVLQPPPVQTLDCALPSPAWPSDHIALLADFALVPGAAGRGEQPPPGRRRGKRPSR